MRCTKCGRNIPDGTPFCGFCGAPADAERTVVLRRAGTNMQSVTPPKTGSRKKTVLWIVIAALACVLLAVLGLIAFLLLKPAAQTSQQSHCYAILAGQTDREDAAKRAGNNGGHLAQLDDRKEFDRLTETLDAAGCRHQAFVLGAHSDPGSTEYYWDDDPDGTPLNDKKSWCSDLWQDPLTPDQEDRYRERAVLLLYDETAHRWCLRRTALDSSEDWAYLVEFDREADVPKHSDEILPLGSDPDPVVEQESLQEPEPIQDPQPVQEPEPVQPPVSEPTPEPTPAPAPEPEPDPGPTEVLGSYSYEQRKNLNIFLSNFSEVFFRSFDRNGTIDEASLVDFAFLHNKINSFGRDRIESRQRNGEYYYTISTADVDNCLDRFFGVGVPHQDFDYYNFHVYCEDGYYYFPAADGESYNNFTIASEVIRDGGVLRVKFDVYGLDLETYWYEDGIDEKYYAMTAAEAASNGLLEHRGSGEAVLENYTLDGSATYRLISYYGP